MMKTERASAFTLAELTRFWNQGYTGYFVPTTFPEVMLDRWFKQGAMDLDNSLIMRHQEQIVGFSFLGRRGERGWIGGFGIAPDFRGKGFSSVLFAEHVGIMQALNLRHVQLEVLSQNWAQKVYARAGFVIDRVLSVLTGELPVATGAPEEVAPGHAEELLAHHARLHGHFPACWQREPAYLTALPPAAPLQGLRVGGASEPRGYLVYTCSGGQLRIVDGAALGESDAVALVEALAFHNPGAAVTLINEPQGSPLQRALLAAGITERQTQLEMTWAPTEGQPCPR
jgi:ribosomal protein S18 acetylase RimI-like enzyme